MSRASRFRVRTTTTRKALAALCAGTVEVALADRAIVAGERRTCGANGVVPVGVRVGYAAPELFADADLRLGCLSVPQLRRLWRSGSGVERWRQLSADLPDRPVRLVAPAPRYPTFRYFTAVVVGERGAIRRDAELVVELTELRDTAARTAWSVAVGPVETDHERDDRVRAQAPVAVDFGRGCVQATASAIVSGAYELRRPLIVYVAERARDRLAVRRVARYVRHAHITGYPGMVPIPR